MGRASPQKTTVHETGRCGRGCLSLWACSTALPNPRPPCLQSFHNPKRCRASPAHSQVRASQLQFPATGCSVCARMDFKATTTPNEVLEKLPEDSSSTAQSPATVPGNLTWCSRSALTPQHCFHPPTEVSNGISGQRFIKCEKFHDRSYQYRGREESFHTYH